MKIRVVLWTDFFEKSKNRKISERKFCIEKKIMKKRGEANSVNFGGGGGGGGSFVAEHLLTYHREMSKNSVGREGC